MSIMASRVIVGGDPKRWSEYAPTKEELKAVQRERVHELADKQTGVIGWGTCGSRATGDICPFSDECRRDAIALRPLTCYKRTTTTTRQAFRAERTKVTDGHLADILDYMRQHQEPVTYKDVLIALGYAETPLLLSGAWKRLIRDERIVQVGKRLEFVKRKSEYVRIWIIKEEQSQ